MFFPLYSLRRFDCSTLFTTGNNQAVPERVADLYVELANSAEVQIFDPEKEELQANCKPIIPALPATVSELNPWNTGALDPPSRAVIRVSLSSTAAFTAEKLEFISAALVAAPEPKVFGYRQCASDTCACIDKSSHSYECFNEFIHFYLHVFSFHLSVSHFDALDEPSLHVVEPQDAAPHVSVDLRGCFGRRRLLSGGRRRLLSGGRRRGQWKKTKSSVWDRLQK